MTTTLVQVQLQNDDWDDILKGLLGEDVTDLVVLPESQKGLLDQLLKQLPKTTAVVMIKSK